MILVVAIIPGLSLGRVLDIVPAKPRKINYSVRPVVLAVLLNPLYPMRLMVLAPPLVLGLAPGTMALALALQICLSVHSTGTSL